MYHNGNSLIGEAAGCFVPLKTLFRIKDGFCLMSFPYELFILVKHMISLQY